MELPLPYSCYFYYYALRGMFRNQDLRLPALPFQYTTEFTLTAALADKWARLFAVNPDNTIPFTFYWLEYEKIYLKAMDALRFNYRNVLHLGHDITFARAATGVKVGEPVRLVLTLKDIVWLDRDRALLLIASQINNQQGEVILTSVDAIFIKGLSGKNIADLKQSTTFNHTDVTAFRGLTKRKPMLTSANGEVSHIYVPAKFGLRYGIVSGDRNPVHSQEWQAKLFGYPHAFIQGSATLNFLLKYFIGQRAEPLINLSLKFTRPIYMEQTIQLRHDEEKFELVDAKDNLLAFGTRCTVSSLLG